MTSSPSSFLIFQATSIFGLTPVAVRYTDIVVGAGVAGAVTAVKRNWLTLKSVAKVRPSPVGLTTTNALA